MILYYEYYYKQIIELDGAALYRMIGELLWIPLHGT